MGIQFPPSGIPPQIGSLGQPPGDPNFLANLEHEMTTLAGSDAGLEAFVNDITAALNGMQPPPSGDQIEQVLQNFLNHTEKGGGGLFPNAQDLYMQYGITSNNLSQFLTGVTDYAKSDGGYAWNLTPPNYTTLDNLFNQAEGWIATGNLGTALPIAQAMVSQIVQLGPNGTYQQVQTFLAQQIYSPSFFQTYPNVASEDLMVFFVDAGESVDFVPALYSLKNWIEDPSSGGQGLVTAMLNKMQTMWAGANNPPLGSLLQQFQQWITTQVTSVSFFQTYPNLTFTDFQNFTQGWGISIPSWANDYFNVGEYLAHAPQSPAFAMASSLFNYMATEFSAQPPVTEADLQNWFRTQLATPSFLYPGNVAATGDEINTVMGLIHDTLPFADNYANLCAWINTNAMPASAAALTNSLLQDFQAQITGHGTLAQVQSAFDTWFTDSSQYPSFPKGMQGQDVVTLLGFCGQTPAYPNVINIFLSAIYVYNNVDIVTEGALKEIAGEIGNNLTTLTESQLDAWFQGNIVADPKVALMGLYAKLGYSLQYVTDTFKTIFYPILELPPPPPPDCFNQLLTFGYYLGVSEIAHVAADPGTTEAIASVYAYMCQAWPNVSLASTISYIQTSMFGTTAWWAANPQVSVAAINTLEADLGVPSCSFDNQLYAVAQFAAAHQTPVYQDITDLLAEMGGNWPSGQLSTSTAWVNTLLTQQSPSFFKTYPQADLDAVSQLYTLLGQPVPALMQPYVEAGQWAAQNPNNGLAGVTFQWIQQHLQTGTLSSLGVWATGQVTTLAFYQTYFGTGTSLGLSDFNTFLSDTGLSTLNPNITTLLFSAGEGAAQAGPQDTLLTTNFFNLVAADINSPTWQSDMASFINKLWDIDGHTTFPFGDYPGCSETAVVGIENAVATALHVSSEVPALQHAFFQFRDAMEGNTTKGDPAMFTSLWTDVFKAQWPTGTVAAFQTAVTAYYATQDVYMKNPAATTAGITALYQAIMGAAPPSIQGNDTYYIDMYTQKGLVSGSDVQFYTDLMTKFYAIGSYSGVYTSVNQWLYNEGVAGFPNYPGLTAATIAHVEAYGFVSVAVKIAVGSGAIENYPNSFPYPTDGQTGFAKGLHREIMIYLAQTPNPTLAGLQTFLGQSGFFSQDLCFVFEGVSPSDVNTLCADLGITYSNISGAYTFTQLDINYATFWQGSPPLIGFQGITDKYGTSSSDYQALQGIDTLFVEYYDGSITSYSVITAALTNALSTPNLQPDTINFIKAMLNLPPPPSVGT